MYKRQGSRASENSYSIGSIRDGRHAAVFLLILGIFLVVFIIAVAVGVFVSNVVAVGKLRYFMDSAVTVSYTHLDVYKRQRRDNPARAEPIHEHAGFPGRKSQRSGRRRQDVKTIVPRAAGSLPLAAVPAGSMSAPHRLTVRGN